MKKTGPEDRSAPASKSDYSERLTSKKMRHRRLGIAMSVALVAGIGFGVYGWLSYKATVISDNLGSAKELIGQLRWDLESDNESLSADTAERLGNHTATAREAASDPLWVLAGSVPLIGVNFEATSQIATSADDLAQLAAKPLISVYQSLDWESSLALENGTDLTPLVSAEARVVGAAHAVRQSSARLAEIDGQSLLPQIAEPLKAAREELDSVRSDLDIIESVVSLAPKMMGAEGTRNYLLLIQNNAELRASGGIPGALALLTIDEGRLTLGTQSSATDIGTMSPIVPLDAEQQQIYSGRMGKFMQDVNLTPDFPTAASTAQAMWERKTGQRVDGVISIDPVALGYILDATGPVTITYPELATLASVGLPTELTGANIVQTLLSDVYARIEQPALQDVYFAGVAQKIFEALSDGKGNSKGLIEGLTRGTTEGRVLVWSGIPAEQSVIAKYSLGGSIAGPSVAPAQFGVYFNDGTGAKMDYYVKRTVQLVKECARDGYEQTTVRVTSTNTAPADATTLLPEYVTGGGAFGVPPGSVQTNIVAYGPVQANVETAKVDGQITNFADYRHSNRPVGTLAVRLAPGESNTVDFTFGKIVQHAEPNIVVTPTVQDVKDVILPTETAQCG